MKRIFFFFIGIFLILSCSKDEPVNTYHFPSDKCSAKGVTFLIESGQESGTEMKKFLEDLDASRRNSWSEDIVWGTGDVSGRFGFLQHVYDSGYKGNLLVEHECGNNRVADIEVALKALLK